MSKGLIAVPDTGAELLAMGTRGRARGTGAAYVYDQLREDILSLTLEPGSLLDETELSMRFDISRSPVREALIRLSAEGLVRTLRNRSSIVAPFDIGEVLGYFDALDLMYRATTRLAAASATADQIANIRRAQSDHEGAITIGDVVGVIDKNRDFHVAIAEASGNPFFAAWTRSLLDSGQRIMRFYIRLFGDRPVGEMVGEHDAIVAAIEARDGDAAEAAASKDGAIQSDEMIKFLHKRRSESVSSEVPSSRF